MTFNVGTDDEEITLDLPRAEIRRDGTVLGTVYAFSYMRLGTGVEGTITVKSCDPIVTDLLDLYRHGDFFDIRVLYEHDPDSVRQAVVEDAYISHRKPTPHTIDDMPKDTFEFEAPDIEYTSP